MVVVCVVICFCCLNMEGGMDFFMFVLFLVRVVVFFVLWVVAWVLALFKLDKG